MKEYLFIMLVITTTLFTSCTSKNMAIQKKNLNTSIDPGNDFYGYANGGWLKDNPLPDEFSRYGTFDKLAEDNQKMVRALIEEASSLEPEKGTISSKVGDFFRSGMDTSGIEKAGIQPLMKDLKLVDKAVSINEVQNILFGLHASNNQILFHLFGSPDKKNSSLVIANLYQGGLGLTDVDYYISDEEKAKEVREKYIVYIRDMLMLAGIENPVSKAETVFRFEERLAKHSMTRLERRDPHKSYNKLSIKELSDLCPHFSWNDYFKSCGLGISELNVAQTDFFREIDLMITDLPLDDWKIYLKWHILNNASPYLSAEYVNRNFDFYGAFLSGRKSLQPVWKRVLMTEDYALGEAIGQMFVEKHFPPEARNRMLDLVANLKIALGQRIDLLEWMSPETKQKAHQKLEAMRVKIGYPDKWRDYKGLEIDADSYYNNIKRAMKFNFDYQMSKIGKEVDPEEWGMTPQTVNAYYSPTRNEIVFPAGILQPPFFYMKADDAVNYGAIGVVIGHEMTHGFDDQGRKYDLNGNLSDWWTEEDAQKFNTRTEVLVNQFNNFDVNEKIKADGKLTLGENIADLGGLNIAFTALKMAWEENPPAEKINGFTPEQRFFLAYAHVWAGNITEQEMLRRTREDVHSLGNLRVNGPLPNIEEFYKAFHLDSTALMYIPEETRASIW